MRRGRGIIAGGHGQPAQLQVRHGGERMLELAGGERGPLQDAERPRPSARRPTGPTPVPG